MQLSANSLIGVSASGGKLLWRYDRVRGSRFRGACHQCVLRDTREMAIIDSNCPRLPAMPHRVGLCRSPGNTTLCHQKRYTPSRSASQAGRREFESPRPLSRQEMTRVASWRLALPTIPTSKRYESGPFRPPICHPLTTATSPAPRGLPSGTELVTPSGRKRPESTELVTGAGRDIRQEGGRAGLRNAAQGGHGWSRKSSAVS